MGGEGVPVYSGLINTPTVSPPKFLNFSYNTRELVFPTVYRRLWVRESSQGRNNPNRLIQVFSFLDFYTQMANLSELVTLSL